MRRRESIRVSDRKQELPFYAEMCDACDFECELDIFIGDNSVCEYARLS